MGSGGGWPSSHVCLVIAPDSGTCAGVKHERWSWAAAASTAANVSILDPRKAALESWPHVGHQRSWKRRPLGLHLACFYSNIIQQKLVDEHFGAWEKLGKKRWKRHKALLPRCREIPEMHSRVVKAPDSQEGHSGQSPPAGGTEGENWPNWGGHPGRGLQGVAGGRKGKRILVCWPSIFPKSLKSRDSVFSWHPDFPCGSDGKESACNARDLGSTPG